jgi:CheY-like chemotaxis protein
MTSRSIFVVGFVRNIYFMTRIESVLEQLGYEVVFFEDAQQIAPSGTTTLERQIGEHLVGPGAILLQELTRLQPALIIFDLDNSHVPWSGWISLIKSVPATRRIPVLCFGPHKDLDAMNTARKAGADLVISRSRFTSSLPNIITKHVRVPDFEAIKSSCKEQLHPQAVLGLESFNRGEYFDAHEYLEEAWMEDRTEGRDLYRSILQIAVAYYQILRKNFNGAAKLFLRVRQWIEPLPDDCRGINVAKLREDAYIVHDEMLKLGAERIEELDHHLLKPIEYRLD